MDNVRKAKEKLAPIGHMGSRLGEVEETDRRIIRQKQEFDALYRQYMQELKSKEKRRTEGTGNLEKRLQREQKIQAIRERKF
jgi:DNA/RNA-binding domain of Phe-tRNA-synthetase-like protein